MGDLIGAILIAGPKHLGRQPCNKKTCSLRGRAVSQVKAPFFLASFTAFCSWSGNWLYRSYTSLELISLFCLLMVALLCSWSAIILYPYSWLCPSTYVGHKGRGDLLVGLQSFLCILGGDSYSQATSIPKLPCRAGRAKRALKSFGVDLPVRAGSSSVLNAVSRGDSRCLILGVTLLR